MSDVLSDFNYTLLDDSLLRRSFPESNAFLPAARSFGNRAEAPTASFPPGMGTRLHVSLIDIFYRTARCGIGIVGEANEH